MSTYSLRRFSQPDALKHIAPTHLLSLLSPHAPYFKAKGVDLTVAPDKLDYEGLARVFINPDAEMPRELVDALYFIHETATPEVMDVLLSEAPQQGVTITDSPDLTPADVAIQVWMQNHDFLERKHAEQEIVRHRSFEYYQTDVQDRLPFRVPNAVKLAALQESLNDWFASKRRGRAARVFVYPKEDGIWFLVRHGEAYKREGSIDQGQSSSVFYRPEKHDVLVYDPDLGELRMHACSKGEKDVYRTEFGRHLFGNERFFPGTGKYSLEPLRKDGAASLVCTDVEGMESVVLVEIDVFWGGAFSETETRRADDLFAAYAARDRQLPNARIIKAKFSVKFTDSAKPRTVTIRPANVALYTRDSDAAILETWLTKRGFIVAAQKETSNDAEPALGGVGASAGAGSSLG